MAFFFHIVFIFLSYPLDICLLKIFKINYITMAGFLVMSRIATDAVQASFGAQSYNRSVLVDILDVKMSSPKRLII